MHIFIYIVIMSVAAYRHLLRAARLAFHGDQATLAAARAKARGDFEAGRSLRRGSEECRAQVKVAEDAAWLLRHNVVQAVETGSGSVRLNIHADTELGDNSSVKESRG